MRATARLVIGCALPVMLQTAGGCAAPKGGAKGSATMPATRIQLTGTNGARIAGYYIRDGRRIELNGVLPMNVAAPGISQFAVRKASPADNLVVSASVSGSHSSTNSPPGDAQGIRLELDGGVSTSVIPAGESLSTPNNALIVIAPYWHEGTWVFDDPEAGLRREPFVAGVPEMIDFLVRGISGAKRGFRLTCSARPFPGFQKKLLWVRADAGGNHYRLEDPPMEGWLCPAMFRYFVEAPKELYVRADPKDR